MDMEKALAELHTALWYKRLNRLWAKAEILLGLCAAGAGLLAGEGLLPLGGGAGLIGWIGRLCLFVLGGYLALAGHRSHLYQSQNELAAYLAEKLGSTGHSSRSA
jgi:hypothetical protein